jgi:hypothetical protein
MKLLIGVSLVAFVPAVDAKCAMTELTPHLLTPAGAKLPADGGILVGWEVAVDRDYSHSKGDTLKPAYKLTDGKAAVDGVADPLAPGVYVYHPKKPGTGALVLVDGKTEVGRFAQGSKDAADLPAPVARKGRLDTAKAFRGTRHSFGVDVDQVPDHAIGVILYSDKHVAMSFSLVAHDKPGATTVEPFQDPSRCSFNPSGMMAPAIGDAVTIAWVDPFGRPSKPSNPIKVERGSTTGSDDD